MSGRSSHRVRAIGLLALALTAAGAFTLTACTSAPVAHLPDGVSVRVFQSRFDYASRTLKVSVTNDGNIDLDLRDAAFSSPLFAGQVHYSDDLVLSPGMTRDLPVALPPPVCSASLEADGAAGPATVVLSWKDTDGHAQRAAVVPTDDTDALARISAEDCLAESVHAVASITVSDQLRITEDGDKPVAWVDITITPTGAAGTLDISQVGSTVLLAPTTAEVWPVGALLTADSSLLTLALDLRPTRCDPHAIAEDKRGTVFSLEVTASGAHAANRSGTIDVPVSDAVRRQIYDWIGQYCAA